MEFHKLVDSDELHDGYRQLITLKKVEYLLLQNEERVYLIKNRCPHMDQPLAKGPVVNGCIRCPSHGIAFDLESGQPQTSAAQGCVDPLSQLAIVFQDNAAGVYL